MKIRKKSSYRAISKDTSNRGKSQVVEGLVQLQTQGPSMMQLRTEKGKGDKLINEVARRRTFRFLKYPPLSVEITRETPHQ